MIAVPPGTLFLRSQESNIDFALEFTTEALDPDEAISSLAAAICVVSMTRGVPFTGTPDSGRIQATTISGGVDTATTLTPGSGYTPNSTVTLSVAAPPPGGTIAQLTANVDGSGAVSTNPQVLDPGDGYRSEPGLTFPAPGGSGTTATGSTTILVNTVTVSMGDGTQVVGQWRMVIVVVNTNQSRTRMSDPLYLYTDE